MRNLGPTTARMLAEVGIDTPDDLRRAGAPMAYAILCHRFGTRINRLVLYAMAGALQDRDLNDFSPEEKAALTRDASDDRTTDVP